MAKRPRMSYMYYFFYSHYLYISLTIHVVGIILVLYVAQCPLKVVYRFRWTAHPVSECYDFYNIHLAMYIYKIHLTILFHCKN